MNKLTCACTDIHTHVVPSFFPKFTGANADTPWPSMADAHPCHKSVIIQGRNYRTVRDACWSPLLRLAEMDGMRVKRQALSPMPELLSYWLPLPDAISLIRFTNEQIAEMVAVAPDRFVGLGGVPLQDVDAAIRELEFVVKQLGFRGVEIASHVNGTSIGDPKFEPFFKAAVALGASVFVHALRPSGMERFVSDVPEQVVGFPCDIGLAAASMITGGTASLHPDLKIAFSHGGGAISVMLPRLMQGARTMPGRWTEQADPPDVIARRFFYDSALYDPRALRFLVEMMGASQVVVGSDYPFVIHDTDPVASIEAAKLDSAVEQALLSTNAERFLGIANAPA